MWHSIYSVPSCQPNRRSRGDDADNRSKMRFCWHRGEESYIPQNSFTYPLRRGQEVRSTEEECRNPCDKGNDYMYGRRDRRAEGWVRRLPDSSRKLTREAQLYKPAEKIEQVLYEIRDEILSFSFDISVLSFLARFHQLYLNFPAARWLIVLSIAFENWNILSSECMDAAI